MYMFVSCSPVKKPFKNTIENTDTGVCTLIMNYNF